MFRTREVRRSRDVLEVDCSRFGDGYSERMNWSNKLEGLLDEELLDQCVRHGGVTEIG
ncbi:hypothetical protein A2U01_0103427, partial [Trifolium medium]|nr:hypothetical protein [Trifolium medium]